MVKDFSSCTGATAGGAIRAMDSSALTPTKSLSPPTAIACWGSELMLKETSIAVNFRRWRFVSVHRRPAPAAAFQFCGATLSAAMGESWDAIAMARIGHWVNYGWRGLPIRRDWPDAPETSLKVQPLPACRSSRIQVMRVLRKSSAARAGY